MAVAREPSHRLSGLARIAGCCCFVTLVLMQNAAEGGGAVYHLDEGNGTLARDSSGAGNNGAISGASYVSGFSGTALRFGAGSWDNVLLPASVWNGFGKTVYFEARVRPNAFASQGQGQVVIRKRADNNDFYVAVMWDSRIQVALYDRNHYDAVGVTGGSVSLNAWSKIGAWYDGSALHLYVNDVEVASQSKTITPDWTGSYLGTHIGHSTFDGDPSQGFHGDIDEVLLSTQRPSAGGSDPGETSTLTLVNGTIAGQVVNSSSRSVTVNAGQPLTGQINVRIDSTWGSNNALAMGVTPTWGSHSSAYRDIGGFSTPVSGLTRTVPINFTAPTTPGSYAIIVAYRAEFTVEQLMSMTNWAVSSPRWDDGNDIAGWDASMISLANSNGHVAASVLTTSGYATFSVPATAVNIVVASPAACTVDANTLCLGGGRFKVQADFRDYSGTSGRGRAVAISSDSGYFWFFDSTNMELTTKIVNFCSGGSGNYGFYASGLTDVAVTFKVTDEKSGTYREYYSPLGSRFCTISDGPFPCP